MQERNKGNGILDADSIDSATASLRGFYDSVRTRASGPDDGEYQRVIDELYERFFRQLFPGFSESATGHESGFTMKNLRQRVIPDLRRALRDSDRSRPLISNVHNYGYRFEAEVENSDSDGNRGWWAWMK